MKIRKVIFGLVIIVLVFGSILLLTNIGKGIQTIEPDKLIVRPKANVKLAEIVARYPGLSIVNEADRIVALPDENIPRYYSLLSRDSGVANVLEVKIPPTFNFERYGSALKAQLQQLSKGNLGTITFVSGKTYPLTDYLKEFILRSFSYLIPGLIAGIGLGFITALLAVLFPKLGKLTDVINSLLLSMPEVLVVALLQLLVIFIDQKAGFPLIAIAPNKGITPFLIPFVSILIMPAAIVYGSLRIAIEREWGEGYIQTAYMKGLTRAHVLLKHIVRNTVPDLLSVLPKTVSVAITTMVIVEVISEILGLGGYSNNPKVGYTNSLIITCSVLAVFTLLSQLIAAFFKNRLVIVEKETKHG